MLLSTETYGFLLGEYSEYATSIQLTKKNIFISRFHQIEQIEGFTTYHCEINSAFISVNMAL